MKTYYYIGSYFSSNGSFLRKRGRDFSANIKLFSSYKSVTDEFCKEIINKHNACATDESCKIDVLDAAVEGMLNMAKEGLGLDRFGLLFTRNSGSRVFRTLEDARNYINQNNIKGAIYTVNIDPIRIQLRSSMCYDKLYNLMKRMTNDKELLEEPFVAAMLLYNISGCAGGYFSPQFYHDPGRVQGDIEYVADNDELMLPQRVTGTY